MFGSAFRLPLLEPHPNSVNDDIGVVLTIDKFEFEGGHRSHLIVNILLIPTITTVSPSNPRTVAPSPWLRSSSTTSTHPQRPSR